MAFIFHLLGRIPAFAPPFAHQVNFGESSDLLFVRMNAQVVQRSFREDDAVVVCCFLDVRERQSAVVVGNIDDLIEPRHRVTQM